MLSSVFIDRGTVLLKVYHKFYHPSFILPSSFLHPLYLIEVPSIATNIKTIHLHNNLTKTRVQQGQTVPRTHGWRASCARGGCAGGSGWDFSMDEETKEQEDLIAAPAAEPTLKVI